MDRCIHDTVSALAYAIASGHAPEETATLGPPFNDLTAFVLEQHSRLPDYLRSPMEAVTVGFDLIAALQSGKRFHRHAPVARQSQIQAWKRSSVGAMRDLVRYYESLTLLALHSRAGESGAVAKSQAAPRPGEITPIGVLGDPPPDLRCEIAVVGSGPGGAITACLLAEAGREVVLIEEGPYYTLDSCEPFTQDEMIQKYRNGGQTVALGKSKVAYVEGRCVGGGSEINSGLYHRTPPEILETWRRDFQTQGASQQEMQPHFEACEKDLSVSLLPGAAPPASLKLHEGASRLGWKSLEVPRWFKYQDDSGKGRRQSMTVTYIPRFLAAHGRLLPRCRVQRIRQENGRWTLNGTRPNGRAIQISAQTVFLCGGAVQTPALLRRCGITRNIGNSLKMHPTVKLTARFAEAINVAGMGVPVHQVKEFAPRLSFGCSISSPTYLALGLLDHPRMLNRVVEQWGHMANYYAMITGEGGGTVRTLASFSDPVVRYRLTEADRRDLADGVRKLTELLFQAGAVAVYPGVGGVAECRSRDELSRIPCMLPAGRENLMTIHLFSSCPMGENVARCATDSFGKLRGQENLFISDASLLCTAPGVNPQGSVMAFARRNALHFLGKA
jgi:choline dehydrogenase-like flavoprotein